MQIIEFRRQNSCSVKETIIPYTTVVVQGIMSLSICLERLKGEDTDLLFMMPIDLDSLSDSIYACTAVGLSVYSCEIEEYQFIFWYSRCKYQPTNLGFLMLQTIHFLFDLDKMLGYKYTCG